MKSGGERIGLPASIPCMPSGDASIMMRCWSPQDDAFLLTAKDSDGLNAWNEEKEKEVSGYACLK